MMRVLQFSDAMAFCRRQSRYPHAPQHLALLASAGCRCPLWCLTLISRTLPEPRQVRLLKSCTRWQVDPATSSPAVPTSSLSSVRLSFMLKVASTTWERSTRMRVMVKEL